MSTNRPITIFDKEEFVTFWKSYASGADSCRFLKDSSTLQDGALFHTL